MTGYVSDGTLAPWPLGQSSATRLSTNDVMLWFHSGGLSLANISYICEEFVCLGYGATVLGIDGHYIFIDC